MGLFDKKGKEVEQVASEAIYKISITTLTETYNNIHVGNYSNCLQFMDHIFVVQYFRAENIFVPSAQIKKFEIIGM